MKELPPWPVLAVVGTILGVALHDHYLVSWQELYLVADWSGPGELFRAGVVVPWRAVTDASLREAHNSLWLGQVVPACVALAMAALPSVDRLRKGLVLWIGMLLPIVPLLLVRVMLPDSGLLNFGSGTAEPLVGQAVYLEPVRVAIPIFGAVLLAAAGRGLFRVLTAEPRQES